MIKQIIACLQHNIAQYNQYFTSSYNTFQHSSSQNNQYTATIHNITEHNVYTTSNSGMS